jgi:hypothetical protein
MLIVVDLMGVKDKFCGACDFCMSPAENMAVTYCTAPFADFEEELIENEDGSVTRCQGCELLF